MARAWPDEPSAPVAPVRRPHGVTVIGYSLLLFFSQMLVYMLLFGRYVIDTAVLPGLPLTPHWQWAALMGWHGLSVIAGIALLRGQRWSRAGYLIVLAGDFILSFATPQHTQQATVAFLLFTLPCSLLFAWLLLRRQSRPFFTAPRPARSRKSWRLRVAGWLWAGTGLWLAGCFNPLVNGLPQVYPATRNMDKLALLAIPLILLAEWIGKRPGALSRVCNLVSIFALFLTQFFLAEYTSPYAAVYGASLLTLRNWAIVLSLLSALLLYWQYWPYRDRQH